jgi:hypothetical protein
MLNINALFKILPVPNVLQIYNLQFQIFTIVTIVIIAIILIILSATGIIHLGFFAFAIFIIIYTGLYSHHRFGDIITQNEKLYSKSAGSFKIK